jgi:DnaJ domain
VIRIALILIVLLIVFYALHTFQKASPEKIIKIIRIAFYGMIASFFIYLVATGRLNGLLAGIGLFAAFVARMLPQLLRYAPYLHRLWQEYLAAKQHSTNQQGGRTPSKGTMTKQEAYEVLGLRPGASEQDIIAAHRKLMQKNHPDRGGSDYLASKINLAKKILLGK